MTTLQASSERERERSDRDGSCDSRIDRLIAAFRRQIANWQTAGAYGKVGVEVDMESGKIVVGRVTSVTSVK